MKLRQDSRATSVGNWEYELDWDRSLSVQEGLQKNKSGLQIILYLFAEWNNIEIRSICEKKQLLAQVTLLWTKLGDINNDLKTLWRELIVNMREELTARWNRALALRESYGKALDATLSDVNDDKLPDEEPLADALSQHYSAQEMAQRVYRRGSSSYDTMMKSRDSDKSNRSKSSAKPWKSSSEPQMEGKLDRADVHYRRRNVHLNIARQEFVTQASSTYPKLINDQNEIAETVKKCLRQRSVAESKLGEQASICHARILNVASNFRPFDLTAVLHHSLEQELTHLPRYRHIPYVDPRDGEVRRRILWGIDVKDETELDNGALLILLRTMKYEKTWNLARARKRTISDDDAAATATWLESRWEPSPEQNYELISPKPFPVRHSLIVFYLSCLPSPLLRLSSKQCTQYALGTLNIKEIINASHPSYITLLKEICDYVGKLAEYDEKVVRQFGKLVLRVSSDLMGEQSKEVAIEGLMKLLISFFKKEREHTVLDIRSPTHTADPFLDFPLAREATPIVRQPWNPITETHSIARPGWPLYAS
ncbi:hypothetical protein CPB86DRAFT_817136 [Serendipita vermifera]|nr:hypothetical protein CPB86DRAFT_817136 [Serendipita vermifera]